MPKKSDADRNRKNKKKKKEGDGGDVLPSLVSSSSTSDDSSGEDADEDEDLINNADEQVKMEQLTRRADHLKGEGNTLFGAAKYAEAILKYQEALDTNNKLAKSDEKNSLYIKLKNNIAQCHLKKKEYRIALDATLDAIDAGSNNSKSFHRASKAFQMLSRHDLAYQALKVGINTCPANDAEQIRKELNALKSERPEVKHIKDKNWLAVNLRKLARGMDKPRNPALWDEDSDSSGEDGTKKKTQELVAESKRKAQKEMQEDREERQRLEREKQKIKQKQKIADATAAKEAQDTVAATEKAAKKKKEKKNAAPNTVQETVEVKKEEKDNDPNAQFRIDFQKLLKDGSEALINNVPSSSFVAFNKAIDKINNNYEMLSWMVDGPEKSNLEVVTIRYIFGRACLENNNYEHILLGKESFEKIMEHHKGIRFPAVYYGMSLLYKKLNRFGEAKKYVDLGLAFLQKGFAFTPFNWPGLPAQVIQETVKETLEQILGQLAVELGQPQSPPDAVCRYVGCLVHREQSHILPSESIYMSDPDYKGHYRLSCREQCFLEYHKTCWGLLKKELEETWCLANIVDKDVLGRTCLTPDCDGIILKVEIYDQVGNVHVSEDTKLMERLKEEERKRREEERQRREEELKTTKTKNDDKKGRKKKKKSPNPETEETLKENIPAKQETTDPDYLANQVDYSQVDLSNATMVKKGKGAVWEEEEDDDDAHRKKKQAKKVKTNKKNIISLDELRGKSGVERNPDMWPGNVQDNDDFSSRVARGSALRHFHANYEHPNIVTEKPVTKAKIALLPAAPVTQTEDASRIITVASEEERGSTRQSSGSVSRRGSLADEGGSIEHTRVIHESIRTFLAHTLKEMGPLRLDDPRVWTNMEEDSIQLMGGKDNLSDFVMGDPEARFRVYKTYICLITDLATCINLHNEETDRVAYGATNPTSTATTNADDRATTTTGQTERLEEANGGRRIGGGLTEQSEPVGYGNVPVGSEQGANGDAAPAAAVINKEERWNQMREQLYNFNADVASGRAAQRGSAVSLSRGAQTDISSLDLDDYNDPFTLQHTNTELVQELQATKDKITKINNDRKIEMRDLVNKNGSLTEELSRSKTEASKLRDENFRMRRQAGEAEQRERELKAAQQELEKTRRLHEQEQKVSFDWRNRAVGLEEAVNNQKLEVSSLKEYILTAEHQHYQRFVDIRRTQNQRTIQFLEELRHNPTYSAHSAIIEIAMKDLDEYAARLLSATDELNLLLEVKRASLNSSSFVSLEFDLKKIESPKLSSNLFLLILDVSGPPSVPSPPAPTFNAAFPGPRPGFGGPPNRMPRMPPAIQRPPGMQGPDIFGAIRPRPTQNPDIPLQNPGGVAGAIGGHRPPQAAFREAESFRPPFFPLQPSQDNQRPAAAEAVGLPEAAAGAASLLPHRPSPVGSPFTAAVAAPERMEPQHEAASLPVPEGGGKQLKKNHDKLLEKICAKHNITYLEANKHILQLREKNGGKLSGMSMTEIFTSVEAAIKRSKEATADVPEKDCTICLDEMVDGGDIRSIEPCKHKFHTKCIKMWLNTQMSGNTCPICRNYVAKDDEFPDLGATRRK